MKQNFELQVIIEALEKNLDLLRDYYEKPSFLKLFNLKPSGGELKSKLTGLNTSDNLVSQFVDALIQLEDGRSFKIQPDKVIPYGTELQKRIINLRYNQSLVSKQIDLIKKF